jgi:thiol-disulfide isomerase/thioredoxin
MMIDPSSLPDGPTGEHGLGEILDTRPRSDSMTTHWAQTHSRIQVPTKRKRMASLCCAVAIALAGPSGAADLPSETAALIEGEAISIPELDRRMPSEVYEARRALYEARRTVLQELIDERLLARAAAAAGESVEAFRNKAIMVDPNVITDADIEAVFEELEIAPEDMTPSARLVVQIALVREQEQEKEAALLAELRTRYAVEVKLPAPRMPADLRVSVEGPENLVRGAGTDAPLELVVFTGFDCAYCAKMVPTFDRLEASYPDELRIVLRHAPLAGLDSEGGGGGRGLALRGGSRSLLELPRRLVHRPEPGTGRFDGGGGQGWPRLQDLCRLSRRPSPSQPRRN